MSSLINTTIKPFKATAYHNGEFVAVTDADLRGKWSVVSSIRPISLRLPDGAGRRRRPYATLQKMGVEVYSVSPTRTSPTRPGTTPRTRSARSVSDAR